ncbi:MAG: hypothetical protein MZV65_33085 [Chromatiales bacterium]|nr:hypothetical protein [Chromatiales bacterium]
MVEKGLTVSEVDEPLHGTDTQQRRRSTTSTTAPTATSSRTRSCSSATSATRRAHRRKVVTLTAEEALNNFEERLLPLLGGAGAWPRPSAA